MPVYYVKAVSTCTLVVYNFCQTIKFIQKDSLVLLQFAYRPCIWGSSVFWYPHQRAYCSAFKSWSGYVNAVVDIFFTKETLAISSARGSDRKGKSGDANIPLTPLIIDALVGK